MDEIRAMFATMEAAFAVFESNLKKEKAAIEARFQALEARLAPPKAEEPAPKRPVRRELKEVKCATPLTEPYGTVDMKDVTVTEILPKKFIAKKKAEPAPEHKPKKFIIKKATTEPESGPEPKKFAFKKPQSASEETVQRLKELAATLPAETEIDDIEDEREMRREELIEEALQMKGKALAKYLGVELPRGRPTDGFMDRLRESYVEKKLAKEFD